MINFEMISSEGGSKSDCSRLERGEGGAGSIIKTRMCSPI